VVSSAEGFIAWLVKPALDDIFLKRDLVMLKLIPLMLLGAYIVKGMGRYGQSYLMAAVGERVIARIRRELYRHIQGMSLSFYSQMHSAELMIRWSTTSTASPASPPPCSSWPCVRSRPSWPSSP
jgi:subfamily B ATP-binding cassette protein MsbA